MKAIIKAIWEIEEIEKIEIEISVEYERRNRIEQAGISKENLGFDISSERMVEIK